jgi:hypothetical protein
MYYLRLTGTVREHNRLEFEQTYRIFCSEIPLGCSGFFISKDVLHESVYHFVSYWPFIESLESFIHSATYNTLVGSFKTLGELRESSSAKLTSF